MKIPCLNDPQDLFVLQISENSPSNPCRDGRRQRERVASAQKPRETETKDLRTILASAAEFESGRYATSSEINMLSFENLYSCKFLFSEESYY